MTSPERTSPVAKQLETSAGGFVLSATDGASVALIGRATKAGALTWCIPKGHPENDEDLEAAAVREVAEETGIVGEVLANVGQIQYEFSANGKKILKTVHHFLLRQVGGELTVENDPMREAVCAEWVSVRDLEARLTHENERRMARALLQVIEELGL
ncbi:MAG: hypothetical protein RL670_772 [Actinomycetota bacterium]